MLFLVTASRSAADRVTEHKALPLTLLGTAKVQPPFVSGNNGNRIDSNRLDQVLGGGRTWVWATASSWDVLTLTRMSSCSLYTPSLVS